MANPKRGKVQVPGQPPKDGFSVEITQSKEPWTEYELDDGTTIKIKQVASEIWRLENEFDNDGNPVYVIKSSGVMAVTAPDDLKRKKH